MSTETYEILALAARYWFLLLAALLVIRGLMNGRQANREERELRDQFSSAGCVGELVVLDDGVKNPKKSIRGARFPVPKEGLIGSGRIADIRIRHGDVKRKHVRFSYLPGELRLKPVSKAQVSCPRRLDGSMLLQDGNRLRIGAVEMMMVFYDSHDAAAGSASAVRRPDLVVEEDEYEDPFEDRFWE